MPSKLALLSLLASVSAVPVQEKKTFEINQVANPHYQKYHLAAVAQAHQKYTGNVPDFVWEAHEQHARRAVSAAASAAASAHVSAHVSAQAPTSTLSVPANKVSSIVSKATSAAGQVASSAVQLVSSLTKAPTTSSSSSASKVSTSSSASKVSTTASSTLPSLTPIVSAVAPITGLLGTILTDPLQYDREYVLPITIGPRTFSVDLDTGSSDFWLLGSSIYNSKAPTHTWYSPSALGRVVPGETWNIEYGDGSSAGGIVYSDNVNLGGLIATNMWVEAAHKVSTSFMSGSVDGVLGAAFDNINTCRAKQCTTFFSSVMSQLAAPLFAADLRQGAPGKYTFGWYDTSVTTQPVSFQNSVANPGFWRTFPTGYSIGNGSTTAYSNMAGIVDSGTTLLYMDPAVVNQYYSQVQGAQYNLTLVGGWYFPCSSPLPSMGIAFGDGHVATVPGTILNYAPVGAGYCFGGLQPNTGIGFNIYGDIFMKSQLVVFDRSQAIPRIGFANKY